MSDRNDDLLDRHRRVMGGGAPLFYQQPLELVRGDGVWLWDGAGNRYLDLYNNVPCVGHANPRVVDAVHRQASTLNVHSRYLHEGVIAYAERLVGLHQLAGGASSLVFTCSGTEAAEVAIGVARAATGKAGIIGTDATYHGNLGQVARLTRLGADDQRAEVRAIATPQRFRPLADGLDDDELCERHLDQLRARIASLEADGSGFAGLLLCSILANEGLPDVPGRFFPRAAEVVHEAGGLLIADEVQAGFARSGSLWGYQTSGFTPDIVLLGKPMGNGIPVAGVVAATDLITGFRERHRYFNTFAGSPVQAAAAGAVLDEIEDRQLVTGVAEVGQRVRDGLRSIQGEHPAMGDVRGHGLFIGVDWVEPGTDRPDVAGAAAMVEALRARGMLLGAAGQHGNVLKIRPPLVFEHQHGELFLDAFADAVAATAGDDG